MGSGFWAKPNHIPVQPFGNRVHHFVGAMIDHRVHQSLDVQAGDHHINAASTPFLLMVAGNLPTDDGRISINFGPIGKTRRQKLTILIRKLLQNGL
jgi:hypothetical protein